MQQFRTMTQAAVSFAGNLTDHPEVRSTEGAIARTVHLVAANRLDSLRRGDDQRRVDHRGGAWSSPGWVMHR